MKEDEKEKEARISLILLAFAAIGILLLFSGYIGATFWEITRSGLGFYLSSFYSFLFAFSILIFVFGPPTVVSFILATRLYERHGRKSAFNAAVNAVFALLGTATIFLAISVVDGLWPYEYSSIMPLLIALLFVAGVLVFYWQYREDGLKWAVTAVGLTFTVWTATFFIVIAILMGILDLMVIGN